MVRAFTRQSPARSAAPILGVAPVTSAMRHLVWEGHRFQITARIGGNGPPQQKKSRFRRQEDSDDFGRSRSGRVSRGWESLPGIVPTPW